jgi:4'-phosphopantetheinyl transferase
MASVSIHNIEPGVWQPLADHTFQLLDEIDIIRIKKDAVDFAFGKMLVDEEIQKMERHRNPQSRELFLTARGAVRFLSGKYTGREPRALVWNEGPDKKPSWRYPQNTLRFNIAHSGDHVLICFGRSEMGIDIERIQSEFGYDEMLSRCFSAKEMEVIQQSPDPRAAFYLFWTRKEALLKAHGTGIHNDLAVVPCLDGVYTNQPGNDWIVHSFAMENYMVSLACSPNTHEVRYWNFE